MENGYLRDQFLRLAGQYPKFRHIVLVGEDDSGFKYEYLDVCLKRIGMSTGPGGSMPSDARAYFCSAWDGDIDNRRPESFRPFHEAEAAFNGLARMSVNAVSLQSLPGSTPERFTVRIASEAVDTDSGVRVSVAGESVRAVSEWLLHVLTVLAVEPNIFVVGERNEAYSIRAFIPPFDSFRASAIALEATNANNSSAAPTVRAHQENNFVLFPKGIDDVDPDDVRLICQLQAKRGTMGDADIAREFYKNKPDPASEATKAQTRIRGLRSRGLTTLPPAS